MSAQDKTEQILREIYILLSKCEVYDKAENTIIVNKKELVGLLKNLSAGIYDVMEEHEMTQQSRDAAERRIRKKNEEIVADARRQSEDVYAASVIYTDDALHRVQDIMQDAMDSVKQVYDKMNQQLQKEKETVHRDQFELKSLLEGMADSDKYLNLIEERNRQLQKEKAKESKEPEVSAFAAVKPEIKINTEYFEKAGISLEEDTPIEEVPEEKKEPVTAQVNVNLDAEYFKWKEDSAEGASTEGASAEKKHSLFGKLLK